MRVLPSALSTGLHRPLHIAVCAYPLWGDQPTAVQDICLCRPIDGIRVAFGALRRAPLVTRVAPTREATILPHSLSPARRQAQPRANPV